MAVRYEEREVKQPKLIESVLVEATCDRCGRSAKFKGMTGRLSPIWCTTTHFRQGSFGPPVERELCLSCSEELLRWIEKGKT